MRTHGTRERGHSLKMVMQARAPLFSLSHIIVHLWSKVVTPHGCEVLRTSTARLSAMLMVAAGAKVVLSRFARAFILLWIHQQRPVPQRRGVWTHDVFPLQSRSQVSAHTQHRKRVPHSGDRLASRRCSWRTKNSAVRASLTVALASFWADHGRLVDNI